MVETEMLQDNRDLQSCIGVPKIEPDRQQIIIEDDYYRFSFNSTCETRENPIYDFLQKNCLNRPAVLMVSPKTITIASMGQGSVNVQTFDKDRLSLVETGERYH